MGALWSIGVAVCLSTEAHPDHLHSRKKLQTWPITLLTGANRMTRGSSAKSLVTKAIGEPLAPMGSIHLDVLSHTKAMPSHGLWLSSLAQRPLLCTEGLDKPPEGVNFDILQEDPIGREKTVDQGLMKFGWCLARGTGASIQFLRLLNCSRSLPHRPGSCCFQRTTNTLDHPRVTETAVKVMNPGTTSWKRSDRNTSLNSNSCQAFLNSHGLPRHGLRPVGRHGAMLRRAEKLRDQNLIAAQASFDPGSLT